MSHIYILLHLMMMMMIIIIIIILSELCQKGQPATHSLPDCKYIELVSEVSRITQLHALPSTAASLQASNILLQLHQCGRILTADARS